MSESQLSADSPLTNPDDDTFGRSEFSRRIAGLIVSSTGPEPPVIGLIGEWGSGKTTVLNFIEAHLRHLQPTTNVLHFNAWRHAAGGRGAIHAALVEQVSGRVLDGLGKSFESAKKALRKYGSGALQAGDLAGLGVPGVKSAAAVGSSALAQLPDSRKRLEKKLREAEEPVVVFIDDVDRLLGQELLELFAAMRVVVDLPYVQYVLAYDQAAVAASLDRQLGTGGEEFLQKIVALPVRIPQPSFGVLYRHFTGVLYRTLAAAGIDVQPLKESMVELDMRVVFQGSLSKPRDIVRYTNQLQALAPIAATAELDVRDFAINEWIAVFVPDLREALATHQTVALLEAHPFESIGQDKEAMPQERARKTFGDLISEERLGAPLARSADKALQEILPDLHAALSGGRSYAGRPATGRLSHPHYYSRYFSYTAWSADAPDSEVDARWVSVLRGASFADEFMTLLRIPDGPRFMDKLVRAIDKAPADGATAARILLQMEEVVRTEEWQREVVSGRLFGDRSAMTMLEFVAVHMLQHAHGFDDPYPALRALSPVRSSRLVYDASRALLQTMRGTNADAGAFVAVGDQMVLERLREPGEFEWYRRHPSLVVDPARSAVRNGGSLADAWTRSIVGDASLMTVVLELTKNLSSEATPEALLGYLQQFVDLPVALPALRVLADGDERAAFWIELIEAAEPGLS